MSLDPNSPDFDAEAAAGKLLHDMEQGLKGIADLAKAQAVMYRALVEEGVPGEHAAMMCSNWLTTMMTLNRVDSDNDDN